MVRLTLVLVLVTCFCGVIPAMAQWLPPKAPVIPEADGYVAIQNVAVPPERDHLYKVIFDATGSASQPVELLPAINNAGSELNAFSVAGVPQENSKFAIVFHGSAVDGILDDAH